jgi:acyl carrier protein
MEDTRIDQPAGQDEQILSPHAFVMTMGRMLDIDVSGIAAASDVSIAADWELDSLQMLEAALAIEELTGSLVDEDEAAALGTLADAYALYRCLCSGGGEPPGPPGFFGFCLGALASPPPGPPGAGALRSAGPGSQWR